jgi:hypothetical protein
MIGETDGSRMESIETPSRTLGSRISYVFEGMQQITREKY